MNNEYCNPSLAALVAKFMTATVALLGGAGLTLSLFADGHPVMGVCTGALVLAVLAWIYPPDEKEY